MAGPSVNVLSLFSGVGGLDLGVHLALRDARTVCYVEREAYAAAVLAARMQDGSLAPAPVWSDVTTFDGRPWRGVVDLIVGGFPCQDISCAGTRVGIAGSRSWLWTSYARIIREVAPKAVLIENVAALVSRGLGVVLADLADLGFDAEWDVFTAGEVGAPHRRRRLFLLAYPNGSRLEGTELDGDQHGERPLARHEGGHGSVGNADHARLEGRSVRGCERTDERTAREASGTLGAFPPGPDGDFPPGLEPAICRVADGVAHRVDRLRACGNGVVPLMAAHAWRTLAARFGT